jgi:hypothetical protein
LASWRAACWLSRSAWCSRSASQAIPRRWLDFRSSSCRASTTHTPGRETYLEALGAAIFAGRERGARGVVEVAEAALAALPAPHPPRPIDLLLDGLAARFTRSYAAAAPRLKRAVQAFREADSTSEGDKRGLWLACRVAADVWDDAAWQALTTAAVTLAREVGARSVLPFALNYRAGVHVHAGQFAAAAALLDEADAIT